MDGWTTQETVIIFSLAFLWTVVFINSLRGKRFTIYKGKKSPWD
jgi:hypothetical protein